MDCDEEFDLEDGGAYPQLEVKRPVEKRKPSFFPSPAEEVSEWIREEQAAGRIPKYADIDGKRVRVN